MSQTKKPDILSFEEGSLSHYRIAYNKYGQKVMVPVLDVRDGVAQRITAYQMIKESNRSKYIAYNEYHKSRKFKNQNNINDTSM
jgi:hypothetical protein